VTELHSDNAKLLFGVTRITLDNATSVDWKQVFLSDSVFSLKLKLSRSTCNTFVPQKHSQSIRRARKAARLRFTSDAKPIEITCRNQQTIWTWLRKSALIYPNFLESQKFSGKYLKVFALPVMLSNNTIFLFKV